MGSQSYKVDEYTEIGGEAANSCDSMSEQDAAVWYFVMTACNKNGYNRAETYPWNLHSPGTKSPDTTVAVVLQQHHLAKYQHSHFPMIDNL